MYVFVTYIQMYFCNYVCTCICTCICTFVFVYVFVYVPYVDVVRGCGVLHCVVFSSVPLKGSQVQVLRRKPLNCLMLVCTRTLL